MNVLPASLIRLSCTLVSTLLYCNLSIAATIAPAATPAVGSAKAITACKTTVMSDLRELRGRQVQRIEFSAESQALQPTGGSETLVKGSGHYGWDAGKTVIPFTYRCTYNAQTEQTNGVVLSDKAAEALVQKPSATWQPDMAQLSPEACEVAVAKTLKEKYPRVGRIAFGSDSRQVKPAPNNNTYMEGNGGVEKANGMSATAFSYRCEFEVRSSKLLSAKTNL
jgi:hypothetical protein